MVEIRDLRDIADKWVTVTPQRAPQYEAGVRNPKKDWRAGAEGANEAWKAGVSAAVQADRFKGGVVKAGTSKWQRGSIEKGVLRYGPGVEAAREDYESGFAPYADEIRKIVLPPRGARRDPRNIDRVRAIATALGKRKEALLAGRGG